MVEYRLAKARVAGSNVCVPLRSSQAKLKFYLSCIRHCLRFSYDSEEGIAIKKIHDIIFIEDMVKGVIPFGAGCYVCRAMRDIC